MPGKTPANSLIICSGIPKCNGSSSSSSSSHPPLPVPLTSPSSSSYNPLPTSLPSSSSSSPPIAGRGNYAAAGASSVLSSSPSSSSSPPTAAVAPLESGIDNLIPGIKSMVWDYFDSKAERGQLALAGLIPREQEGHLLLSYEITGEMPLSARRIPPVGGRPSVLIPTNKMSFCTENTDDTIMAINSQWNLLNPWRLTVLTVKPNPAELRGDLNKTMRILNGIKATLGHVKTLILVVGRLSLFFTSTLKDNPLIIKIPDSVCESNSDFLRGILYNMMVFEFSSEGNFCNRILDAFKNTAASPGPLTGIIVELHDTASWDWYQRSVPATGPTDPRLHLMVSNLGRSPSPGNVFWDDPVKVGSLRWLSYFFYDSEYYMTGRVDLITLDFSRCTRLVELCVYYNQTRFKLVVLPIAVGRLEKLWLELNAYYGPPILPVGGPAYPHLRHFCLSHSQKSPAAGAGAGAAAAADPAAGPSVLSISSDRFQSLQLFGSLNCRHDEVLDFSNFRTPGLSLNLSGFKGTIRMPAPEIQMGTLTLETNSIARICSFDDIIPRFPSLNLSCSSLKALLRVFDRVNRRPLGKSEKLESAHLKKLVIRDHLYRDPPLQFGAFPELESLTLGSSPAILDGANFPLLEELNLDNSNSAMLNCFGALRSLNIKGCKIPEDFSMETPLLEKLSIIGSDFIHKIVLNRNLLPNLQQFTILPTRHLIVNPIYAAGIYPGIAPDPKCENSKIITIFYEKIIPDIVIEKWQRGLCHSLPIPIQYVDYPLVDPLPEY